MAKGEKIKVLSIYRDYLSYQRGTPLRVKSILSQVSKDKEVKFYTASRDEISVIGCKHLQLSKINLDNILRLSKFIKKNDIDIVIFHTIAAAYYAPFLYFLNFRIKIVLEMHGFPEEESVLYGDLTRFRYYRNKTFYYFIYKISNKITVCSDTAKERISKYNKNTSTIYGGVDLSKFNRSFLSAEKNNERKDLIVGYSGNGRKWQGLDFLLEAFLKMIKDYPDFKLRLLLSEKVNIPLHPRIEVLEPVNHDQVALFNASCDILVIPRADNVVNRLSFPSKLMEYLAMGLPVVASETSDMYRIIKDGHNGKLYPPGDMEEFIKCFLELKDPKLRKKIGLNAYNTAKMYSWEKQGKKFLEIIKAVK